MYFCFLLSNFSPFNYACTTRVFHNEYGVYIRFYFITSKKHIMGSENQLFIAHQGEYLKTSLWYREVIEDPYQIVAAAFDFTNVDDFRETIKTAILAACSDKIYRRASPADLMYDFKIIESVVNAAYLINLEKKKSSLVIEEKDLLNKELYRGRFSSQRDWDDFPRFVCEEEYVDPYLVFKRFFKYQRMTGWKQDMELILQHALGKCNLFEMGIEIDVLSVFIHLTKLIEAAHLIDVREITCPWAKADGGNEKVVEFIDRH